MYERTVVFVACWRYCVSYLLLQLFHPILLSLLGSDVAPSLWLLLFCRKLSRLRVGVVRSHIRSLPPTFHSRLHCSVKMLPLNWKPGPLSNSLLVSSLFPLSVLLVFGFSGVGKSVFWGGSFVDGCLPKLRVFAFVVEFEELVTRVDTSLENASPSRRPSRPQNPRNRLRRSMIKDHPVVELFVSSGVETAFFFTICQQDVSIATKGVRDIGRQFASDKHRLLDVTYRVHQGLQVYNKLLDPMELSDAQTRGYLARPFKEKPEGFSFPEDF